MTSTELDFTKKAIVMKSGLVFWVTKEKVEELEAATQGSEFQHMFVRISELNETINTSQIEGFYTAATYEAMQRVKSGEKQCQWGEWHVKIRDCECAKEARRKWEDKKRKDDLQAQQRPRTPEEIAVIEKMTGKVRKQLEEKGVIGGKVARATLTRSGLNRYKDTHGFEYEVPAGYTVIEDV